MTDRNAVINGRQVSFEPGQTILEAARANGIDIPTMCHLEGCTPTGACRICVVEIKGARSLVASCALPIEPGMEIQTESEMVRTSRRMTIELLLASGEHECVTCESNGDCRLQDLAYLYQVETRRFARPKDYSAKETSNPFIIRDFSRCVLCGRCVQACNEVQVNNAISLGYRGSQAKVVTRGDLPLEQSDCVFCGECTQVCPVGALVEKKAIGKGRPWETEKIRTTCPYCGVGCQLLLHVKEQKIGKVTGIEDAESNHGRLCVKGRFGYDFINSEDRLTTPLIRENGRFRSASWDEALGLVADRLKRSSRKAGRTAWPV